MAGESTQPSTRDRPPLRIGEWQVDPSTGRIHRGDETVRLAPKVMDVLLYLADRPGKVVRREELEGAVWAGTVVGYDALTGAMKDLRKGLGDDSRHPQIIETLSKKGYRLIAPVAAVSDPIAATHEAGGEAAAGGVPRRRFPTKSASVIAVLLVAAGVLVWWGPWTARDPLTGSGPTLTSVAVMPFDNLGGDPEQEYFADGITDDLITDLTQISSLLVISRDSSFAYKGAPRDVHRIARELNVRYVLHGSVRRSGGRLRINAQLTDATTGTQLWAGRYDGELRDVFRLQDEITQRIMSALAVKLTTAERQSLARQETDDLAAYDAFLQGEERFFRYARSGNQEARASFEKAIFLDPNFARARAMLAWTHTFDFMNGWSTEPQRSLALGERLATQALELDDKLPLAYFVRGLVYRERGEYVKALVEAENAVGLDPNYANGHVLNATLLYYAGRPKEGLERMKKAIKLNPHHPNNYPFHVGQAYFVLGQYAEAIEVFKQGLETNPTSERLRVWLAAAYAQAGNLEEARWEIEQVLIANSEFSLERVKQAFPFTDPADLDRFVSGLEKAGLSSK
jgi:TolB-like protein/DNA-binding winged helix-turn-helix (wHTH) protein